MLISPIRYGASKSAREIPPHLQQLAETLGVVGTEGPDTGPEGALQAYLKGVKPKKTSENPLPKIPNRPNEA